MSTSSPTEDLERLVLRAQGGESGAMPELWERVSRFVSWKSRTYFAAMPPASGAELDDLTQSGWLALNDAVRRYDPHRESGSFLQLFSLCLKTAFRQAAGGRQLDPLRDPATRSLSEPIGNDEDAAPLEDVVPSERDDVAEAEDRVFVQQLNSALNAALDGLQPAENELLRRRYYAGVPLAQLAERAGTSTSRIQQRERDALRKLRQSKDGPRLREFLDGMTDYYSGHSAESVVCRRETLTERYLGGKT